MKYELTNETTDFFGITLRRIRALRSFGGIAKGDLGGWVQSESNLSQGDSAWVYGDARVYGDAWVFGDARVYGDAWVFGDALVYDNARVYGNARVSGDARVSGNARIFSGLISLRSDFVTFCFLGVSGTYVRGGFLQIGCQEASIEDPRWDLLLNPALCLSRFGHPYSELSEYFGDVILDICLAVEGEGE